MHLCFRSLFAVPTRFTAPTHSPEVTQTEFMSIAA